MTLDRAKFNRIAYDMTLEEHERFNIGTYKEKKLHRILKLYLEEDRDYHEVPCQGFIADIKREDRIIEIETSGFTGLRDKLEAYLPQCQVTLVYPLASVRYISWIDPVTGEISPKRRSPKKATAADLLFECIYIADYLADPHLTILGICLEMQEYRMLDGWSRDKKKGSHRYERMPVELLDMISLHDKADYAALLPDSCRTDFTMKEFCKAMGTNQYTGRAIIKVYKKLGLVAETGKKGRCLLYSRA